MALPKSSTRDQSVRVLIFFRPPSLLQKSLMAQPGRVYYVDYDELVLPYPGMLRNSEELFFLLMIFFKGELLGILMARLITCR